MIPLSKAGTPLYRQVYLALREAILSGAFHSGEKLPSSRDLAEQLGISRTIVLVAYDQLLAEGFAVGRSGSGTYVSSGVGESRSVPSEDWWERREPRSSSARQEVTRETFLFQLDKAKLERRH